MSATADHSPAWQRVSLAKIKADHIDGIEAKRAEAHALVDQTFDALLSADLGQFAAMADHVDEHIAH